MYILESAFGLYELPLVGNFSVDYKSFVGMFSTSIGVPSFGC